MSNQYSGYGGNPYEEANNVESGANHAVNASPYAQYDDQAQNQQYEMANYAQPQTQIQPQASGPLDRNAFLNEASSLRTKIQSLNSDINSITALHQRALASTDTNASADVDSAVSAAQDKAIQLKNSLAQLDQDISRTPAGSAAQAKSGQYNTLKKQLQETVQRLMQTEADYSRKYREQIARQYRVANPGATEEEVQAATEQDWSNEGVFQTALHDSRMRHAQNALGAVRARHNDLQHIERSIQELALLFDQIDSMVVSQGAAIEAVDIKASEAVDNMEAGNKHVDEATAKARHTRKLKWYCTWIVVVIILALALGIGLGVGLK
ncbi:Protein transport protein SSO2 [Ceratocystis fimbriata CBS 114723]|uniref:Protein transport protein SSO2 n=1 Tax=Ceratocystis fimbriata CBS 114723 TaxID=1035309 RepID=A0A2C5XAY6_9PEZI|nr:Protein transport protein SSO2 [Ceratocystis fimbriata CBS 114723]